ncbi:hypothetical protein A3H89_00715 [Candidatus Amesbacteria bacterium RIFCSPLOWO2_02_FULL_48_11]|uniref:Uncharacterized protein n=1 Tax=Candidatus Amesbacteria bacterium RIFCSPHIGHO2_12_FULL_48_14 TaxID=1797257 RepID=A0A1F4Z5W3_9BACT|nr:MAG: hypothetical protein A3C34_01990 [Candidatus Amesbacteria bacterium RIFCSPHIGHO2_02_FULL_48_21]OGC98845.1 MAG: hypothetical protein A2W16_01935 [Candidatus Amesbacteria bacterium RBG_16_48_31]OGD01356.1 MAG: hypothetical protein A3E17_04200 [Candidatus Amesbacteria bacterium RIFCSPHIGHO2_12_FULL_48_14]OGD05987.1 MAG: hypothetical protein A3H89_00715 [Candidatus Amesbacteria bacterium RIFCSPLOWO2_02_FULL_48_11]
MDPVLGATPVTPPMPSSTPITPQSVKPPAKPVLIIGALVIILAGAVTGYFISRSRAAKGPGGSSTGEMVKSATEVGSTDTQTFRDTATGVLEKGGFNGEGTHKLIREGGPTKTAYLVSSIVDLDEFVGKKVEIWGETMKPQKVGWLMDVGRVKILE